MPIYGDPDLEYLKYYEEAHPTVVQEIRRLIRDYPTLGQIFHDPRVGPTPPLGAPGPGPVPPLLLPWDYQTPDPAAPLQTQIQQMLTRRHKPPLQTTADLAVARLQAYKPTQRPLSVGARTTAIGSQALKWTGRLATAATALLVLEQLSDRYQVISPDPRLTTSEKLNFTLFGQTHPWDQIRSGRDPLQVGPETTAMGQH
jgi:hypothetical protein